MVLVPFLFVVSVEPRHENAATLGWITAVRGRELVIGNSPIYQYIMTQLGKELQWLETRAQYGFRLGSSRVGCAALQYQNRTGTRVIPPKGPRSILGDRRLNSVLV